MAEVNTSSVYVGTDQRSLIGAVLTGVGVGIVGWLAKMAIQAWIIEPIFCRSTQTYNICSQGGTIAWAVALIIVSMLGLLSLVRLNVFRPLLVVIAALISLWAASTWLGPLEWWLALLWQGVLFGLAYALFAWIARLRSFFFSVILTFVVILLARVVVLNS